MIGMPSNFIYQQDNIPLRTLDVSRRSWRAVWIRLDTYFHRRLQLSHRRLHHLRGVCTRRQHRAAVAIRSRIPHVHEANVR